MKNSLQKGILGPLVVLLIVLTVVGTTNIEAAATPGTRTGPAPLAALTTIIPDPLTVQATETGKISLSTDGMGVNTGALDDHGTIRVDKPSAGATVRKAYLMSATTGRTGYALAPGDVLLDGADVFPWDATASSHISSNNYWKDVTSIVKPVVDAAPAGIVNFDIDESNGQTGNIDGEALAVIFDDPSQPTDNTVVLLFGAQSTTGDTFNVALGKPADFTDPNFGIGFGLGISYGVQVPGQGDQFSDVTVNGNLMSASAGGQDDGAGLNGALITVGGIGDLPNVISPPDCASAPRCDKERYMLSPPFINNGDTTIKVNTLNPSNDDNIFFAWFDVTSSTAIVTSGPKFGSISGMKFNDLNANGIKDMGELGLPGWTITLTNSSDTISTMTDASGNYVFAELDAGTYTVGEVLQAGWTQTAPQPVPPGTYTVTLAANEHVTDKDFGNFREQPPVGSISGMKFNDLNANGTKDIGEPGLANWTITLTNQTGNTVNTITDANGNYSFTNLSDGNYTVGEILKPGWIQTAPAVSATGSATYTVNISGGNQVVGEDFGNFKDQPPVGSISGMKFNDLNANGTKDIGEPGLANWTITLTNQTGNTVNIVTDANGNYSFTNLSDGNYTVGEILKPGWIQTAPAASATGSATYTVNISGGNHVVGEDFGNFRDQPPVGSISGMKWEDLNANGIKDPDETGIAGWNITINGTDTITGESVNITTMTDTNGSYWFMNLTAGTYVISEKSKCKLKDDDTEDDHKKKDIEHNNDHNVKDNDHNNDNKEKSRVCWVQTWPATGNYTVIITSGSIITGLDFGNFKKGKITGGGDIPANGKKATFRLDAQYPDDKATAQGNVEYQDRAKKLEIKSIQINTVATTRDGKKGVITGLARVNGKGSYYFEVYVEDNGEHGKGVDVFRISLPTYPYSNGAVLSGENIQIQK